MHGLAFLYSIIVVGSGGVPGVSQQSNIFSLKGIFFSRKACLSWAEIYPDGTVLFFEGESDLDELLFLLELHDVTVDIIQNSPKKIIWFFIIVKFFKVKNNCF